MSEPSPQPGKDNKPKRTTWSTVLLGFGLFLMGTIKLLEALESNQTWKLILAILIMVCGGVGGALGLWLVLRKHA
jgi:hypothetical protein